MPAPPHAPGRAFCPKCGQKYAVPEEELKRRPGLRFRATCRFCGTAFSVRWHDGGLETDVEELVESGGGRDLLAKGVRVGSKYEIEEILASGGSSTIYRAFEQGANRTVALKVLHREPESEFGARFRREVEVQGNLKHPNIMPIFDQGLVDGKPYYTMELLHKPTTLETIVGLFRGHRLGYNPSLRTFNSLESLVRLIVLPVAKAIHFANANGVIHRDLKPGNVIVDARTMHVYVIDFGICHTFKTAGRRLVLRAGEDRGLLSAERRSAMGTMRFMPPEQARGDVSERGDVWALGALLHYVVTGDAPIAAAIDTKKVGIEKRIENLRKIAASSRQAGDEDEAAFYERRAKELESGETRTVKDLLRDAQEGNYVPLRHEVDAALRAIIERAMRLDPQERYEDGGAFAADLQRWLDGRPVRAYAARLGAGKGTLYRGRLFVRRNKAVVLATAAVLALAVIFVAVQVVRAASAEKERIATWLEEARRSDDPAVQEDRLTRILALRPNAEAERLLALARKFGPIRERMQEAREVKDRVKELRGKGLGEAARQLGGEAAAVLKGSVIRDIESLPADYPGRQLLDEAVALERYLRGVRILTLLDVPRGTELRLVESRSRENPELLWDEAESWGVAPLPLTDHALEGGSYVLLVDRPGRRHPLHLPFVIELTNVELHCPIDPDALPEDMVYVSGAEIEYGDLRFQEETRRVVVEPFFLDAHEVTNAQYARYLATLGPERARRAVPRRLLQGPGDRTTPLWDETESGWSYQPGTGEHPVLGISLIDAEGYAAWAGKRLPSPEEWELAARGVDGRDYPFGNRFEPGACNALTYVVADVGAHPRDRSPFGAYDLAGNVAEWTNAVRGDKAIVKGGSFEQPRYRAIATSFDERRADLPYADVGFRCAK